MIHNKTIRLIVFLIVSLLIMLSLSTCSTLQSVIQEPSVSLRSVDLVNINFTGIELMCKVNVENRMPVDIPFPDFDWELFINANSFVKGSVEKAGSIRARQTSIVEIPVSLNYMEIFNAFQSLKENKNADYAIALGVKIDIPVIGEKIWNLKHAGVFPVLQIPKFSAPSMKIDGIDFSKVQLAFSVNVENPNEFEIPSPQLIADFLINRNSYNSGISVSSSALAASAVTPVIIAFTLHYTDLYRLFSGLLNLSEVPALVSLNGDFGIPAFAGEKITQEITGSIPLLKAPQVSFNGISLKNISLTRADFELSWEVENNNSFAMNVNDLSYNFTVNNTQWSSGKIPGSPLVNANSKTAVNLEFSVNNLSIINEIYNIIAGTSNIAYALHGNLNLNPAIANLPDFQTPFNFSGNTRINR